MRDNPNGNIIAAAHEIAAWPKGSDTFVEAFAKGLAVIGAFGDARDALSLADLATRTGLPRAGVRRLVLTLQALGLATHQDGRFRLSPRVMRLGYAYLSSLGMVDAAQPVIEALARSVDEVVAVSVLDGTDITYVARAEVRGLLRGGVTIGSRLPAYATSMGRAMLAHLPDDSLARYLRESDLVAFTRYTKADVSSLLRDLAKVRKLGCAVVSQELELGVLGIAAPIRNGRGQVVAALNISTNLARHEEKALVRQFKEPLLQAVATIEQNLPLG